MTNVKSIDCCVACGSSKLVPVLDLGNQPPANSYKKTKEEQQEAFPLAINRCEECYHVQLTHAVNPDILFKNYLYVSGTSQTMKDHFKWFAEYARETFMLYNYHGAYTILDIGCNDGSQLDAFKALDCDTYGVDPAENLHERSSKNHSVHLGYWDDVALEKLGKESFDIIIAQNVFAHNADPVSFLRRARQAINREGLIFIQTSQADMILNNEFDTIYHEHISFFNIKSMKALCARADVDLLDVIKCPLHGNSYIFVISKNPDHIREAHIDNLIEMEDNSGLYSPETYETYAKNAKAIAKEFKELVEGYMRPEMGWYTVGYGAAAKGMTLLNYADVKLDFIIDDNPLKQGTFTPGKSIPIVPSTHLDNYNHPVIFVPLAWNFFDEIKAKIKAKRPNQADFFITYFPKVKMFQ